MVTTVSQVKYHFDICLESESLVFSTQAHTHTHTQLGKVLMRRFTTEPIECLVSNITVVIISKLHMYIKSLCCIPSTYTMLFVNCISSIKLAKIMLNTLRESSKFNGVILKNKQ